MALAERRPSNSGGKLTWAERARLKPRRKKPLVLDDSKPRKQTKAQQERAQAAVARLMGSGALGDSKRRQMAAQQHPSTGEVVAALREGVLYTQHTPRAHMTSLTASGKDANAANTKLGRGVKA